VQRPFFTFRKKSLGKLDTGQGLPRHRGAPTLAGRPGAAVEGGHHNPTHIKNPNNFVQFFVQET